MIRRMQFSSRTNYWRALSGLLLVVFLLRAMIAVGYMPTKTSGDSPVLGMSLCISGLSDTVIRILALDLGDTQSSEPHDVDCAFGAVLNPADLLFSLVALAILFAYGSVRFVSRPTQYHDYRPQLRGPPLGSRAPPVSLAACY